MKRLDDDTRTMQDIVGHETLRGALARFCRSCLCEELALFVIRMHTYAVRLAVEGVIECQLHSLDKGVFAPSAFT